ncbi:MAG: hypothetical protein PVG39_08820 [Desulfobacteraceae bacterium]
MIDIKYDQNRKMLNITVSGISDFNEFSSTLETITNSTDYPPNVRAVWDIRKADFSFANFQLVREVVKIRRSFKKRDHCRSALIVSGNLQYGLGRMFEMLSDGKIPHQFMVFRDYEEGEQWLLKNQPPCQTDEPGFPADSIL